MRQLVSEHALQLLVVEHPHDAFGHGHRRVLRTAAGGERIGRVTGDQVHSGHGNAGPGRQPADDAVEIRGLGLFDRLSPVHGQHDAVREPVAPEVHRDGQDEGYQHALLSPDGLTDQDHQAGERCQQNRGLEEIPHRRPSHVEC